MFLYALLLCSGGSSQTCLPPQYFTTQQACVGMANSYKIVGNGNLRVSCVKISREAVVK